MTNGTTDDEDFGALFEASIQKPRRRLTVGERVRGVVTQVGRDRLILDLGDGQDALMERGQLGVDAETGERPDVKEGDVLEAFVLGFDDRVPELGMRAARGAGGRVQIEAAYGAGLPVEGSVVEVNKGGYVVDVGGTRCFCPLGAMDVRRIEDPSIMIGRRLSFRVTEMKGTRDVVLSRRAIVEEENARRADETRRSLVVGAILQGTVTNVRDFGAFVDVGGVEGLVPASELGFGWSKPLEAVSIGQEVEVQIVSMEPGKDGRERLTLSMKALMDDPFDATATLLTIGTTVAGTVTRVQPFGAFIELLPGVEGLLHVSAFGKRVSHPSEMVRAGQVVAVRVDGVDAAARRISLHWVDQAELANAGDVAAPPGELRILRRPEPRALEITDAPPPREDAPVPQAPPPPQVRVGDVVEVTVDKAESFGVFVSWPGGRGLVPGKELGLPRDTDLRRHFPVGKQFRAVVLDIRADGKIALSLSAVERAEERAETDAYMRHADPRGGAGLGTLGDLFAAKKRGRDGS